MTFGSALQRTRRARISVPSSSTTPSPGMICGDGDAGGELGAGLARGVGDREADHPHAALDVAPDRALALEVALVVHELDRRGALVLRAALGGDHALAEQRVLEALVARCSRRAPRRSRPRRRCRASSARRRAAPRSPRASATRRSRCRARRCAAACGSRRRCPRRPSSRRCRPARRRAPRRRGRVRSSSSHWPKEVPSSNGHPEVRVGDVALVAAAAQVELADHDARRAGRRRTRTG